ncbi:hypothetical protein EYZ11_002812 [Aspergillus tanneri]|uniref:DUF8035 domain-containing protein n=1 Tax=Aspergillus tanneri TaxID=1220188 RepID=A0A4S3JPW8_9EURO|nr:uncharacterized protein ATNIH1004_003339 [Aspergillus tanneri]KAA8650651.1 hypothetical protein ATNIH1004_003339 [Aspergillus tanneri]THC97706.1 hypothetical protein EYZ11_002812 [Aspergillus tanneri]
MSRYDDYHHSSGALEADLDRWDADRFSRERRERHRSRGPPVLDRPRRVDEERFEYRLQETDRYGPPARRPDRHYEDDHLIHPSGPLVAYDRSRGVSPPPRPRLLRRQSSLDTFDRIPSRKLDEYYYRAPPSPPPLRSRSGAARRSREQDYYEEIRIAEPEYYGDEEYRGFRERDRFTDRPRRSSSQFPRRVVEEVKIEKPYPRKGKTRMPRRLVHTAAIREFGYPFEEEGDMVIIQVALSKEQIDNVISRSREMKHRTEVRIIKDSSSPARARPRERIVERLAMESYTPSNGRTTLLIEPASSRHRSQSRHYDLSEKRLTRTVSRARSISVHGRRRRRSSPVRMIERHDDRIVSDNVRAGPLAIIRPRSSDDDLQEYMQLDRRGRSEVIRDTQIINGDGDQEEITEVKRERKGPNPRIVRAMMATLT